jgi:hypothetical protein
MEKRVKRPARLKESIPILLHGTVEKKQSLIKHHFFLSDTPRFMKDLGLIGEFFAVRYGVIVRHKGKDAQHSLTEQNWIALCEKIIDPFAITKHGDGYNLFTNIKVNGKWVMAGILVKNAGKSLVVNELRTVFGANSTKGDTIVYQSEKITPEQRLFLAGPIPPISASQGLDE